MKHWVFRDYLTERGENIIRRWLDSLPKRANIKIDLRLRYLENVQYLNLEPQYVKSMVGYEGIYEIRVVLNNVQYRPLGCYVPGERGQFALLIGAVEKGDKLEPKDACELAEERKHVITFNKSRLCDHFE
jgi:putative component of toxin-antitoxin plasmid stabilization module